MPNTLLSEAVKEVKHLESGEVFLVKDLFKGYEWNRIPINDRMRLGILFLHYVESKEDSCIDAIEKSSSNQQKYRKR